MANFFQNFIDTISNAGATATAKQNGTYKKNKTDNNAVSTDTTKNINTKNNYTSNLNAGATKSTSSNTGGVATSSKKTDTSENKNIFTSLYEQGKANQDAVGERHQQKILETQERRANDVLTKGKETREANIASNPDYEYSLYQYSNDNGETINGLDMKNEVDDINNSYSTLNSQVEDAYNQYQNRQIDYNSFMTIYNNAQTEWSKLDERAEKINSYTKGSLNTSVVDTYNSNKERMEEILTESRNLKANGGSKEDIEALNTEYVTLKNENEQLQLQKDDVESLQNEAVYDYLKASGDTEQFNRYKELLSHSEDNDVQRLVDRFVGYDLMTPAQTVADIVDIGRDVIGESYGNALEKLGSVFEKTGIIDDDALATLQKASDDLKSFDATNEDNLSQEIRRFRELQNEKFTYGIDSVPEQLALEVVDSALENTARRLMLGELSTVAVGLSTFGESYNENIAKEYGMLPSLCNATAKGVLAYVTEMLPTEHYLTSMGDSMASKLSDALGRTFINMGVQGGEEFLEEGAEGIGDYLTDKFTYWLWGKDESQDVTFQAGDVLKSGLMAAASASLSVFVGGTLTRVNFDTYLNSLNFNVTNQEEYEEVMAEAERLRSTANEYDNDLYARNRVLRVAEKAEASAEAWKNENELRSGVTKITPSNIPNATDEQIDEYKKEASYVELNEASKTQEVNDAQLEKNKMFEQAVDNLTAIKEQTNRVSEIEDAENTVDAQIEANQENQNNRIAFDVQDVESARKSLERLGITDYEVEDNTITLPSSYADRVADIETQLGDNTDGYYEIEISNDSLNNEEKNYINSVSNEYNESETNNINSLLKDGGKYNKQKVVTFISTDKEAKKLHSKWVSSQENMVGIIEKVTGLKTADTGDIPFEKYKYKNDGNCVIDPGAKSIKSTVKKIMKERFIEGSFDYSIKDLKDHNRLSIQVKEPSMILNVVQQIRASFPNTKLEVKNGTSVYKFDSNGVMKLKAKDETTNLGYIGFHVVWEEDGINHEVQITPDFDLKMRGEYFYNKWRNTNLGQIRQKIDEGIATKKEIATYKTYLADKARSVKEWNSLGDGEMPSVISSIVSAETGHKYSGDTKNGSVGLDQDADSSSKNPTMNPSPLSINDNLFVSSSNTIDNPVGNSIESTSSSTNIIPNYINDSDELLPKGEQRKGTKPNDTTRIKAVINGKRVGLFTRTMTESTQNTNPALRKAILKASDLNSFKKRYESNEQTVVKAWDSLAEDVASIKKTNVDKIEEAVVKKWLKNPNRYLAYNLTKGSILAGELAEAGNIDLALKVSEQLEEDYSEIGRSLQSARIWKILTPKGKLRAIERNIANLNKRLALAGKEQTATLSEETKAEYLKVLSDKNSTEEDIKAITNKVEQEIADSVPATIWDKMNAWRYVAMLGNVKTMERNVLGNTISVSMSGVKDIIKTLYEVSYNATQKEKIQRTSSLVSPLNANDKKLIDFAKNTFESLKDKEKVQGKYKNDVIQRDTNFNSKPMQALEKFVSWGMNNKYFGDTAFVKARYANVLAQYMKANNISTDVDKNSQEFIDAQEYAWNEAERSAFHEANNLAKKLNALGRGSKIASVLKESVMPYTTTPLNVARQGINYSPLGFYHIFDITKVKNENSNYTMNDYLDYLAQATTGTGIMLIGAFLAKMGILRTKDDDKDKKNEYEEDIYGDQDYSIKIGDASITVDWMTPLIIPLAIGAEFQRAGVDLTNFNVDELVDLAGTILDPLSETTMLSSLQSTLKSYGNSEGGEYFVSVIRQMLENYVTQYIPTAWGQVKRAIDNTRYDANHGNETELDRFKKVIENKTGLPISDIQPYVNSKGEYETNSPFDNTLANLAYQTLSPGYISVDKSNAVDDEMERLYSTTGDDTVFPSKKATDYSYNGETTKLYNEDYTKFNVDKRSEEYQKITEFVNSEEYQNLTDEERVEVIDKIRGYGTDYAKDQQIEDYKPQNSSYLKVKNAEENGTSIFDYYLATMEYNKLEGDDKKQTYVDYLNNSNMSDDSKWTMYGAEYGESKMYGYLNDMDMDSSVKLQIANAVTSTEPDYDSDGNVISNSKAKKLKELYTQLGVYDDIVEYVNTHEDASWSSFGLTKTVVGSSSTKSSSSSKKSSSTSSTKSTSTTSNNTSSSNSNTENKTSSYSDAYKSVFGSRISNNGSSTYSDAGTSVRCWNCGNTVVPYNGKCPVCGANL